MLRKLELTLTTYTATFLHGALGKDGPAEWRGASFKGLAHYWFRALLGPQAPLECRGSGCARCVRCLEALVFGSAASATGVKFEMAGGQTCTERALLLPHKGQGATAAFKVGARVGLILRSPRPTFPERYLRAAAWSVWTAVHLGGAGQRSRRGAGSLGILTVDPEGVAGLPEPTPGNPTAAALADYLKRGLTEASRAIGGLVSAGSRAPAGQFPMIASGLCEIHVAGLESKVEADARKEVMMGLRPHKDRAFGSAGKDGRRASPLWVRLQPGEGGRFLATRTVLLPRNSNDQAKLQAYLKAQQSACSVGLPRV